MNQLWAESSHWLHEENLGPAIFGAKQNFLSYNQGTMPASAGAGSLIRESGHPIMDPR